MVPPLRWATTLLAGSGDGDGARACTAALAQIATDAGQDEAMSALSHALGELALLDGNAEQAAAQFGRGLELFLSPRTVELHVQNIVAKLDCRSRADAARRASELGLLASSG